jgi:hypothetical protein
MEWKKHAYDMEKVRNGTVVGKLKGGTNFKI